MTATPDRIPGAEFHDNTQQRTPCLLLLDCSGSMSGNGNMARLNRGIQQLEAALREDPIARNRVQVAVIEFGGRGASLCTDWIDATEFSAPQLIPDGATPMGQAVDMGLRMIEERKALYNQNGISYTRPWMFLISDGAPTDTGWEQAAARCARAEAEKKVLVWPLGVDGADLDTLARFKAPGPDGKRMVFKLEGTQFIELFQWLSTSLSRTSQGAAGGTMQLAAPPAQMMTIEL